MQYREWLEQAKRLPIGQKKRLVCPCGNGKSVMIANNGDSYSGYCFRCGAKFHEKLERMSLEQTKALEAFRNEEVTARQSINWPTGCTDRLNSASRTWLYKSGITDDVITLANIKYSSSMDRCVLPVFNSMGNISFWQARSLHPLRAPKYINPIADAGKILYQLGGLNKQCDTVVVTEDILSTIKIQMAAPEVDVVSILGTKTTDFKTGYLAKYSKVIYMLDPDKAGQDGNREGIRRLGMVTDATSIKVESDPKELTQDRLRDLLSLKPKQKKWRVR